MQKNCYKRLLNTFGEIFCDTLEYEQDCIACITSNTSINNISSVNCCKKDALKCLVGIRKTTLGFVFACGQGYGKKTLFIQDLDCLAASLTTLSITKKEVGEYLNNEPVTRIRRVLHNVRSINAHSLQEIRSLVPEYILKKHKNKSCMEVEKYIKGNAQKTAVSLFNISKDLYEIKAEFSVYDKLIKGEEAVAKRPYNIRDVIMIVLYPFFEDFNKKNVVVNVEDYYESIPVDFETIQVALYHIIENASKYVQNDTDACIIFRKENGYQQIVFKMQSLHINPDERDLIFIEGYSGKGAQLSKLNGDGIGMYRAKRLIELNGGRLLVDAGTDIYNYNGMDYSSNKFIISLPL